MVGGSESRRRRADEMTSHRQKTLPRPISNKEVIKGASKCALDFEGQPVREGSGKGGSAVSPLISSPNAANHASRSQKARSSFIIQLQSRC